MFNNLVWEHGLKGYEQILGHLLGVESGLVGLHSSQLAGLLHMFPHIRQLLAQWNSDKWGGSCSHKLKIFVLKVKD